MTYKISVVGGGTSGWMTAAYLKSIYNDLVDIEVIYDHSCPSIGVGESTTPIFLTFLNQINISYEDLIKEIGSTIKLGIKFKNWCKKQNHYWHPFNVANFDNNISDSNVLSAYETMFEKNQNADCYDPEYMSSGLVPFDVNLNNLSNFALHIDGQLFSKFLRNKFKNKVKIIDGVVVKINYDNQINQINSLVLNSGQNINSDLYIDCTGLSKLLISKVSNSWIECNSFPLMNRSIPIQIKETPDLNQTHTLAEAHKFGWLWNIPLQERYGMGYNYNSNYLNDDQAVDEFKKILKCKNIHYNSQFRIIKYLPGYFKEPWKSNVLSIGLSTGFVEPLEATSIHMICNQLSHFVRHNTFFDIPFSQNIYNKKMSNMYEQTLEFIELHYYGERCDSIFWNDVLHKKSVILKSFIEKSKKSYPTASDIVVDFDRIQGSMIFGLTGYTRIMEGLGLINIESAKHFLNISGLENLGENVFNAVSDLKKSTKDNSIQSNIFYKRLKKWQI